MKKRVIIDCFPESALLYGHGHTVVAIDVIRASTSIVTALISGRRCFPVPSVEAARVVAARLQNPLVAGEQGGAVPHGFEMNNSPWGLDRRADIDRPLVLLSSSGTRLIDQAQGADAVYIGCFRNMTCLAEYLAGHHRRVVLLGAGSRGDFREEDQLACAWIARKLLRMGYSPDGLRTEETIEIWNSQKLASVWNGKSADFLRRTGQAQDLDFIMRHIDDARIVPVVQGQEVIPIPTGRQTASTLRELPARVPLRQASYS